MIRQLQPELLDTLPPADPRAMHSRRDLRRVNAWMRHPAILTQTLVQNWSGPAPRQITELGAGDGSFLLSVAQIVKTRWPNVNVTLLDQQSSITAETLAAFGALGWSAEAVVADVFAWPAASSDLVVANLFLHHFTERQLVELLRLIACRTKLFIAIEPRRGLWPLVCSRLLGVIGCNDVTRHDAAASVRAGFSKRELSARWPDWPDWQLTETTAGLFSHRFSARRNN